MAEGREFGVGPCRDAPSGAGGPVRSAAAAEAAALDWLANQAGVVALWRELLVSADGDHALVAALDQHADFLTRTVLGDLSRS